MQNSKMECAKKYCMSYLVLCSLVVLTVLRAVNTATPAGTSYMSATFRDLCSDTTDSQPHVLLEEMRNNVEMPTGRTNNVTGVLVLTKPLTDFTVEVQLTRCTRPKTSTPVCDKLAPIVVENFCGEIGKSDRIWSLLVDNLQGFTASCPIDAGRYAFVDAPVGTTITADDSSSELQHGITNFVMKFISEEATIFCMRGSLIVT